jgi:hypothetical protein
MYVFNLFGTIIGLKYDNGSFNYKSNFGGVFFLATLALALGMIMFYGKKFVLRDLPTINQEIAKTWNPPPINLDTFPIAIMTQGGGRNEFHDDIFKIVVSFNFIDKINNLTLTSFLPNYKCSEHNFVTSQDRFRELELDKARCFDLKDKIFQGSNLNTNFSFITIQFQICLDALNCMDMDSMQKNTLALKSLMLLFICIIQLSNLSKKKNFISKFVNSYQVKLTFDDLKASNIFLSNNSLNVQSGYLFSYDYDRYDSTLFDNARD